MNLGRLALGLLSIFGGVSALKRGSEHLRAGLKSAPRRGPNRYAKQRGMHGVISETRHVKGRLPKLIRQGTHVQTKSGPIRTTLREVNHLDDRLAQIIDLAHKGKFDPTVIAWTRTELTKKCRDGWNGEQWCVPEKNTEAEIMAIFKALRRDTRYTSDILGADTYMHPRVTTKLKSADCDDFSSKGAAALMSVGIPVRFKVIQTKRSSTPDHIFIQAGTPKERPKKWVSLDASVPMPPGWEAPPSMVSKEWIYPA